METRTLFRGLPDDFGFERGVITFDSLCDNANAFQAVTTEAYKGLKPIAEKVWSRQFGRLSAEDQKLYVIWEEKLRFNFNERLNEGQFSEYGSQDTVYFFEFYVDDFDKGADVVPSLKYLVLVWGFDEKKFVDPALLDETEQALLFLDKIKRIDGMPDWVFKDAKVLGATYDELTELNKIKNGVDNYLFISTSAI